MVASQSTTAAPWRYAQVPPMEDLQFRRWVKLLEARTGICLPESRKSFLLTSLVVRMREQGFGDYQSYYDYLVSGAPGRIEWETLVDRLTVHETRFYRDENALELIRDEFFPSLLADEQEQGSLHLWSIGCATGEEPYTLAMLADDFLQQSQLDYRLGVTASDISRHALAIAREARYPANRINTVPVHWRERYFDSIEKNRFRVKASIRRRVCFVRLNLLELEQAAVGRMDLIYCQNVLIYFKQPRRLAFLDAMVEHLKPGGLLILGAGEVMKWRHPKMEPVERQGVLAYRRMTEPRGVPV